MSELGLRGSIFVSGGAGYLGRGIMRRAARDKWDCSWTVFSRDEEKHRKAREKYKARYILGDILETEPLMYAMVGHDIVIHAAALKYIPECEDNPARCVTVNIDGTRSVISAARQAGVKQLVIISTDKAPQPINTYGMTKAICERLVQETFNHSGGLYDGTKLVAVRYGNVIGSTGSIWPIWKQQRASEEAIRVTDERMTRYMQSIDAAVDLIVAAVETPLSGLVILPRPCAINLGVLSKYVAKLWKVPCRVIGQRPGEKTHEQMISDAEKSRVRIMVGGKHYCLLPPGYESDDGTDTTLLLSSDRPFEKLTPEEFVKTALDSEGV